MTARASAAGPQRGSAIDAQFELLVTTVKDYAIFLLDPSGHVASWNAGAQHIKGYEAKDVIGRHISMFYTAADVAQGRPKTLLDAALAQGRVEDEGWRVRKDGTQFWANVVITALRTADGELVGFAKVTRDLTHRRAAEQKALETARHAAAEEALRRAAEMRSTLRARSNPIPKPAS